MAWYRDYKPYVPVARRRAQAAREVSTRIKTGEVIRPVVVEGRKIASTFWGKSWCDHLESYSDYANRLPRGRTYVRNGSVLHLAIEPGRIKALVSGSAIYEIEIQINPLSPAAWRALKDRCAGEIGTIVELLQGKLSKAVMEMVTDRDRGLFPKPNEIRMRCSCPDGAGMCKHLAAVMYGVGSRLDTAPELLFHLRSVDHAELIAEALPSAPERTHGKAPRIAAADLGDIFGIELDDASTPSIRPAAPAPVAGGKKMAARTASPTQKAAGAAASRPVPVAKPTRQAPDASPASTVAPIAPARPTPVIAPRLPSCPALKALIAEPRQPLATSARKVTPRPKLPVAAAQTPTAPAKKVRAAQHSSAPATHKRRRGPAE